jgi:hypothetical protein
MAHLALDLSSGVLVHPQGTKAAAGLCSVVLVLPRLAIHTRTRAVGVVSAGVTRRLIDRAISYIVSIHIAAKTTRLDIRAVFNFPGGLAFGFFERAVGALRASGSSVLFPPTAM